MANPPHRSRHSPPPVFPLASPAPGAGARLMRPPAMRWAVSLMYVGAVAAVVRGLVDIANNTTIITPSSTSPHAGTVQHASSLAAGITEGIVIGGLWLWMAWKTGTGWHWARVLSCVFFGLLSLTLIGSVVSLAGRDGSVGNFIVTLVEWGVGLAAIVELWRPESSGFFSSAQHARLTGTKPR